VMLEGKLESPFTFRYLKMLCKCCAVVSTFLTSTLKDNYIILFDNASLHLYTKLWLWVLILISSPLITILLLCLTLVT